MKFLMSINVWVNRMYEIYDLAPCLRCCVLSECGPVKKLMVSGQNVCGKVGRVVY